LRMRPRAAPTRSVNQRARALSGWERSHNQASSTIALRAVRVGHRQEGRALVLEGEDERLSQEPSREVAKQRRTQRDGGEARSRQAVELGGCVRLYGRGGRTATPQVLKAARFGIGPAPDDLAPRGIEENLPIPEEVGEALGAIDGVRCKHGPDV
jgi:hypothetical protein